MKQGGPLSVHPAFSVDGNDSPRNHRPDPALPDPRSRLPSGLEGKELEVPTPAQQEKPQVTKRDGDIEEFQRRRIQIDDFL